jgi:hypothetical protein
LKHGTHHKHKKDKDTKKDKDKTPSEVVTSTRMTQTCLRQIHKKDKDTITPEAVTSTRNQQLMSTGIFWNCKNVSPGCTHLCCTAGSYPLSHIGPVYTPKDLHIICATPVTARNLKVTSDQSGAR